MCQAARVPSLHRITTRIGPWLRKNAYLGVAAGALLVLTRTVEFSPPEQVRTAEVPSKPTAEFVGEAFPAADQRPALAAEAVQLRATLRRYTEHTLAPGQPTPDDEHLADPLSEPVVTTVMGVEAEIRQTIRLGPERDIDLAIVFTPRLLPASKKNASTSILLDHSVTVHSRTHSKGWGETTTKRRVHLDTRGVLTQVESTGYPLVFAVDDQLFRLELSLERGG